MTPREVRFILRAHRTDGRYAPDDPVFREALAEAAKSPELADWLEREHELDESVAHQIAAIQPPVHLRETILAGARASTPRRRWWPNALGLATAAAIAVILSTSALLRLPAESVTIARAQLAEFALNQLHAGPHEHDTIPAAVRALAVNLSARPGPLPVGLHLSASEMGAKGCQAFAFGGREVFEVCFERHGVWYHLYATRRDHPASSPEDSVPLFVEDAGYAAVAWAEGENVYTVATRSGREALRRVI